MVLHMDLQRAWGAVTPGVPLLGGHPTAEAPKHPAAAPKPGGVLSKPSAGPPTFAAGAKRNGPFPTWRNGPFGVTGKAVP